MRVIGLLGGCAAALVVWACASDQTATDPSAVANLSPAAASAYTILDLGTLGGSYSQANGINSQGQAVGYSETAAGCCRGFLWENGVMSDLGTLGGDQSFARGINPAGQVVGTSGTAAGEGHAFLWEKGVMTDLGTLGGSQSEANAINPAGQVVGVSTTIPTEEGSGDPRAFLWDKGVNAVYHATGRRIRELPITPDKLL